MTACGSSRSRETGAGAAARPLGVRPVAHRAADRHPDPAAANVLALADLDGGAVALVSPRGAAPARGFGVKVGATDDLERTLEVVMLDLIAVLIEIAPFAGRAAAEQWSAVVERRGVDPRRRYGFRPRPGGRHRPHRRAADAV